MIHLPANLELLRKKRGMKQSELALLLGVKPNTISNYENGISQPDYYILQKLMEVFDVCADELLYSDLAAEPDKSRDLNSEESESFYLMQLMKRIDQKDLKIEELNNEKAALREELGMLKENVRQLEADDRHSEKNAVETASSASYLPRKSSATSTSVPSGDI